MRYECVTGLKSLLITRKIIDSSCETPVRFQLNSWEKVC